MFDSLESIEAHGICSSCHLGHFSVKYLSFGHPFPCSVICYGGLSINMKTMKRIFEKSSQYVTKFLLNYLDQLIFLLHETIL